MVGGWDSSLSSPAEILGIHLTDKGHCCQDHTDQQNTLWWLRLVASQIVAIVFFFLWIGAVFFFLQTLESCQMYVALLAVNDLNHLLWFCILTQVPCNVFSQVMKLTPFEEEELMKKWQEILGPSNEVVVSFFFKEHSFLSCITLFLSEPGSWAFAL